MFTWVKSGNWVLDPFLTRLIIIEQDSEFLLNIKLYLIRILAKSESICSFIYSNIKYDNLCYMWTKIKLYLGMFNSVKVVYIFQIHIILYEGHSKSKECLFL